MFAPGVTQGVQEQHTLTFLYDHRGRLMYAADLNNATGKERREQLYWDTRDHMIERVITPDSTAATTYSVDILADLEGAALGWLRLEYVNGAFSSETRRYAMRDPVGLVSSVYSFTGVGATTSVYTADHLPFGELRTASSSIEPGLSMHNQVALTGTAARVWQGQGTVTLRAPLTAERAQVWDSRVAQYIGASPSSTRGGNSHPYMGAPPSGLASSATASGSLYIGPSGNRSFDAEPRCGDFLTPTVGPTSDPCDFCPRGGVCIAIVGERVTPLPCPPPPMRCTGEVTRTPDRIGYRCELGGAATWSSEEALGYWIGSCLCDPLILFVTGECEPRVPEFPCHEVVVERDPAVGRRPRRICDGRRTIDEPSWWGRPATPYIPDIPEPYGLP